MKEYQKIKNIFEFDSKYRSILGMSEPFKSLKNLEWQGTEKVDGTNIRIHWDGHEIEIAGRTDRAQIPEELLSYLTSTFKSAEMEYVFEQIFEDKDTFLFGEGFGPKIQSGGGLYSDSAKFILFDVQIEGFDLKRDAVNDIASKLNLPSVPVVFEGTLENAIEYVKHHNMSTLGEHKHEMEGIVLVPKIQLYDNKHNLIKCKCKYRDMVKGNLITEEK